MHPNFVHPRAEIPGTDVDDMVTRFRETIMTAFGLAGAAASELSRLGARPAGAGANSTALAALTGRPQHPAA